MYRLNVTFVVEPHVQDAWLAFVRDKFIPGLRAEGYNDIILSKVLSAEAADHFTWSLLVALDSMQRYTEFTGGIWPQYADVAHPLFGDGVVWFMSLLKEMECRA